MKKIIPFALFALFLTSMFFGSCTKEILKEIVLTDTVKIITNTVTGMDSVKADFIFTINYQREDSIGSVTLFANTSSYNVPSDAIYSWTLDGKHAQNNQNYYSLGEWSIIYGANGSHVLAMSITCPGLKKVFTVAKTFTIKLKN